MTYFLLLCRGCLSENSDSVAAVDLRYGDLYHLAVGGGEVLAHIVRTYRELPVTSVNEHSKLYGTRSAALDDSFESGARASAGEDNVVNDDNVPVPHVKRDICPVLRTVSAGIIAVRRDIELTERNIDLFQFGELVSDTFADSDSP